MLAKRYRRKAGREMKCDGRDSEAFTRNEVVRKSPGEKYAAETLENANSANGMQDRHSNLHPSGFRSLENRLPRRQSFFVRRTPVFRPIFKPWTGVPCGICLVEHTRVNATSAASTKSSCAGRAQRNSKSDEFVQRTHALPVVQRSFVRLCAQERDRSRSARVHSEQEVRNSQL